jgi:hypothetical protein
MFDPNYFTARFLGCSRRRLMAELERDARIRTGQHPTGRWWAEIDGKPLFTWWRDNRTFKTEREALKAARGLVRQLVVR